jgi:hypothetical protein
LRSWVDISSLYKEYPTGEAVQIALRHTLVDGEVRQASGSPIETAFDAWHKIMDSSDMNGLSTLASKPQDVLPHSAGEPKASDADGKTQLGKFPAEWQSFLALATGPATQYHFEVLRHALKKCFFSTVNGYFGTAAGLVEEGDRIAVFAGLEMPVVLRRVDQGYSLITHAYVHGIMHGEAWPANAEISEITLV